MKKDLEAILVNYEGKILEFKDKHDCKKFFEEEFFETKQVVHVWEPAGKTVKGKSGQGKY